MIKVHHKIRLLIFFLFLFIEGLAQEEVGLKESTPTLNINGTFHHGALLPHRKEVNEIVEGHTRGYELSFYKSTIGNKNWQQLYNYPNLGVSVLAMNLGNDRELGMGYGFFPFIEIPLNKRKINFRLKAGYGIGYIEKPFDKVSNYKNIAIGSNFNALIYGNVLGSIKLSKAFNTSAGISLIHFSNGSFSRPNLGINMLSLNTGITYSFGERKERIVTIIEERPHVWTKKMTLGVGLKEIPPIEGPKYFISSYSFNFIKTRAQKSSYGFGADVFYNTSLSQLIANDTNSTSSGLDNFRLGFIGIYSFDFGRISVLVEFGVYAFTKYKGNGFTYNRLETRYNISDKLFLTLAMKTHIVVADLIQVGVGFNLK